MRSITASANQITTDGVAADKGSNLVKTISLAAFAVLSLEVGAAFAQGLPAGTVPPVYGSQAFSHHSRPAPQFLGDGTVFAKLFGQPRRAQTAAGHTAGSKTASAKGG